MTKLIDPKTQEHLDRLHAALFNTYNLQDVVRYIEERTFLSGDRYSFKDHEFQKDIISDVSRVVCVQKCAQVGLSEVMARYVVGLCAIMPYFSAILTMPYSGDASNFVKTRIDPFINESPDLKKLMGDPDNTTIKAIGTSLFYARGTSGETAALSVPADLLVHDEVDRSDPFTIQQYQSRIKHSPWKLTRLFGTPTVDGRGIAAAMAEARRKRNMVKCSCCNHWFAPSYHSNVVIPGYTGELRDITKSNINTIRWQEAHVICPACGRLPSLAPEHREWVVENRLDNFEAVGYYVTPFEVPNVVPTPQIVYESTKFTWNEFCNQTLGETNSDSVEELTKEDIKACMFRGSLDSSVLHCIGGDMGNICHLVVGRMVTEPDTTPGNEGASVERLLVVHRERVPLARFRERLVALKIKYKVLMTVLDSQPYTDLILELQKRDLNLFGAVYHFSKKLATYAIIKAEQDETKGKLPITQASVHRNINFDHLMALIKARRFTWAGEDVETNPDDAMFMAHCLEMKRTQTIDRDNEIVYQWVKPLNAQDHFFHAVGYLQVACKLMGTANRALGNMAGVPLITVMKIKARVDGN